MEKVDTAVFTTYFSKKNHPQFGDPHLEGVTLDGRVKQEDISYIGKWYNSLNSLGIDGRVFYDNLSDEFVRKYETNKIKFVKCETSDYSYNDWRFFCYRDYLEKNKFKNVFMTDGSDVSVVKNPEEIINFYQEVDFFLCKDSIKLFQFPYLQYHNPLGFENYISFFLNQYEWDLINMGVIGAKYENMMTFLNLLCSERIRIGNPEFNADIWTGNYIFRHKLMDKKLLIGEPFTSNFKRYEYDRKDVYFIHK